MGIKEYEPLQESGHSLESQDGGIHPFEHMQVSPTHAPCTQASPDAHNFVLHASSAYPSKQSQ